ncbi:LOG family protein [Nocardioides sp. LHG3406-4]|uniref:LOG family protein n=1 Tax=Nocardioides sp. LHG3406-4 TaxID=2804575 RepID=UPI003CF97068
MRRSRGRVVDVETAEEFVRRVADGTSSLSGWRLSGIDLTNHSRTLAGCRAGGALFLGCRFADGDEARVRAEGALVFPQPPDSPVDGYRTELYTARELYGAASYRDSLDGRAYAWSKGRRSQDSALAKALHDHAIDQALARWVSDRDLVGVMGGHAVERGSPGYADAARLGHLLGASRTVATGGGPGAMEAANLGARLAGAPAQAVDKALAELAAVPSYRPSVEAWAAAGFDVLDRHSEATETLGVPTWHYGHEPPNVFATAIAKYFGNPAREAVLLQVCNRGIVFLGGAAGTVQEIFQDACENYYADESAVAPMVLVGSDHWTRVLPAWPLLQALARGRPMEQHVHLVETVDEAAELVSG